MAVVGEKSPVAVAAAMWCRFQSLLPYRLYTNVQGRIKKCVFFFVLREYDCRQCMVVRGSPFCNTDCMGATQADNKVHQLSFPALTATTAIVIKTFLRFFV